MKGNMQILELSAYIGLDLIFHWQTADTALYMVVIKCCATITGILGLARIVPSVLL